MADSASSFFFRTRRCQVARVALLAGAFGTSWLMGPSPALAQDAITADNLHYSWIGNTVGGLDDRKIPDFVLPGCTVDSDGTIYSNVGWEEANANVSFINPDGTPGPRNSGTTGTRAGRRATDQTSRHRFGRRP